VAGGPGAGAGGAEIDERRADAEPGAATPSRSEPAPREAADADSDAKDAEGEPGVEHAEAEVGVEPDAEGRGADVANDVPVVLAERDDDLRDEPEAENGSGESAATGAASVDAQAEPSPPGTHRKARRTADDEGTDDDATELTPLPDATIADTAGVDTPHADTPPAGTAHDDGDIPADPVGPSVTDLDPPAPSNGPRFVPPPYDPTGIPAYEPTELYEPTERVQPGPAPEPVAQVPDVRAPVPQQYATGAVPILEIEGGWEAVHRRRRRQTLTFLAGLVGVLVLGLVAWLTYSGVVPWPFGGSVSVAQNVCTHSQPLPPKKITVRVFNGSSRDGLASQVAGQLKGLGFAVKGTGNDPLETKIKSAAEIRHGENGDLAAATIVAYVVGKTKDVQDDRQDGTIDLVLGPSFARLHSKGELKKSLAAVTSTLPMTCPAGVTPTPATPTPKPSGTPKARVTPRPSATPKR
jgi:hypothetical protein